MPNVLLGTIYKDVYGKQFSSDCFSNRMKMQNLIYLLQEAGISVKDYNFQWYQHGPYSQQLQNDMLDIDDNIDHNIRYSESAQRIIHILADLLHHPVYYPPDHWVECLASLEYLKRYVCTHDTSDDLVIRELIKRKPHLNNIAANKLALEALRRV